MSQAKYRRIALGIAAVAFMADGCGWGGDAAGSFRTADGACQVHQRVRPSTAYTGGVNGDTEAIMYMMGSYTVHGKQAYCDGRPATATDRAWRQLYVRLGGAEANLSG